MIFTLFIRVRLNFDPGSEFRDFKIKIHLLSYIFLKEGSFLLRKQAKTKQSFYFCTPWTKIKTNNDFSSEIVKWKKKYRHTINLTKFAMFCFFRFFTDFPQILIIHQSSNVGLYLALYFYLEQTLLCVFWYSFFSDAYC